MLSDGCLSVIRTAPPPTHSYLSYLTSTSVDLLDAAAVLHLYLDPVSEGLFCSCLSSTHNYIARHRTSTRRPSVLDSLHCLSSRARLQQIDDHDHDGVEEEEGEGGSLWSLSEDRECERGASVRTLLLTSAVNAAHVLVFRVLLDPLDPLRSLTYSLTRLELLPLLPPRCRLLCSAVLQIDNSDNAVVYVGCSSGLVCQYHTRHKNLRIARLPLHEGGDVVRVEVAPALLGGVDVRILSTAALSAGHIALDALDLQGDEGEGEEEEGEGEEEVWNECASEHSDGAQLLFMDIAAAVSPKPSPKPPPEPPRTEGVVSDRETGLTMTDLAALPVLTRSPTGSLVFADMCLSAGN